MANVRQMCPGSSSVLGLLLTPLYFFDPAFPPLFVCRENVGLGLGYRLGINEGWVFLFLAVRSKRGLILNLF